MQQRDVFSKILRACAVVLGIWAMYAQICVLLGKSFNELLTGAWIPALLIAITFYICRKLGSDRSAEQERISSPQIRGYGQTRNLLFLGICSVAAMLIGRPGHPVPALLYSSIALIVLFRIRASLTVPTIPREPSTVRNESVVFLVMIATIIVTSCEHRVNWDDAKYLHIVATALQHPDEPMLVYDHLHGVPGLKILHPSVQLQTYELLVAVLSKVSHIHYLKVYYLILPAIWAALTVIAQWILIRRLSGKHAPLALVATFLLLAVWGGHRSFGAFAFDFVGRGIFLTFAVPALISTTLDYVEVPNFRRWLFLFLSVWTGCLFTSTAYAVAPVAIMLVLISCYALSRENIRPFASAVLTFLWCPILLFYVTLAAPVVTPVDVDTAGNAHTVFFAVQGRIAFILFALSPFFVLLARLQSAEWIFRYNVCCFFLLLSGLLLDFVGKYSSILSWRLLWAIPVPVIVGVGLSAAIQALQDRTSRFKNLHYSYPIVVLLIFSTLFAISGDTVVFRNFGLPKLKMDQNAYPVVRRLVRCSKSTDLMLAPPEIAVPTAGMIGAPSLIAVRGHHLSYLSKQWGEAETERRKLLFNIVQGKRNSAEDVEWAYKQLVSGQINRVVLNRNNQELIELRNMLQSLNIGSIRMNSWEVWLTNSSSTEQIEFRSCLEQSEGEF